MSLRGILSAVGCALMFLGVTFAFQKPWREYPAVEYNNFPLPPDYQTPGEWTFARLMYPNMDGVHARGGYGRRRFAAD